MRHGKKASDDLVVVINFNPAYYQTYRIGVPREGAWSEIFNSDDVAFGGSGKGNRNLISSVEEPMHGRGNSIELTIPPLAGIILKRRGPSRNRPKAKPKAKHAASKRTAAAKKKAAEAAAPTKKASARKSSTKAKSRGTKASGGTASSRAAKSDN